MEVKALPKSITDEIRFILEGIKNGQLEHNQEYFHCGSAHCVAGWHQVLKYKKQGFDYDSNKKVFIKEEGEEEVKFYTYAIQDPLITALVDWKLTEAEAHVLFSCFATLPYQFALLEWLEQGRRLYDLVSADIAMVLRYEESTHGKLCIADFFFKYLSQEIAVINAKMFLDFAEKLIEGKNDN